MSRPARFEMTPVRADVGAVAPDRNAPPPLLGLVAVARRRNQMLVRTRTAVRQADLRRGQIHRHYSRPQTPPRRLQTQYLWTPPPVPTPTLVSRASRRSPRARRITR